jgi:hypothetical protein
MLKKKEWMDGSLDRRMLLYLVKNLRVESLK